MGYLLESYNVRFVEMMTLVNIRIRGIIPACVSVGKWPKTIALVIRALKWKWLEEYLKKPPIFNTIRKMICQCDRFYL